MILLLHLYGLVRAMCPQTPAGAMRARKAHTGTPDKAPSDSLWANLKPDFLQLCETLGPRSIRQLFR